MSKSMNQSQPDFGVLWDRFVDHMSRQYGFKVKNVIGGVGKYRKIFIDAQQAVAEELARAGAAASEVEVASQSMMPSLPPYVYGREVGPNEKVFTEQAMREHGQACYAAGAAGVMGGHEGSAPAAGGVVQSESSPEMIQVCMRAMYTASQGDFDPTAEEGREVALAVLAQAQRDAKPLDMVLHCPECGLQHVDEPDDRTPEWDNPPHRSHLCHGCKCVWRPADVPTNGVRSVKTRGKADTWRGAEGAKEK